MDVEGSGSSNSKKRTDFDIVDGLRDPGVEEPEPLQKNSIATGSYGHRSTNSSLNGDDMEVEELALPERNPSTGGGSTTKHSLPRILKGLYNEDIIATPRKFRDKRRYSDLGLSRAPSPKLKRSRLTRNAIQTRSVSYDVKFHPMDTETRPNAPARRKLESDRVEIQEEDSDDEEVDEIQSSTTEEKRFTRRLDHGAGPDYDMTAHPLNAVLQSDGSSASGSKASKPSVSGLALDFSAAKIGTDWDDLDDFDKRLYTLQGGAPEGASYLALMWSEVARSLVRDGFLTKQQLKIWGGESKLKERYELVRKAVQGDFADTEAKEKDNQPLYWLEGFDVYDMEAGAKEQYMHKNIPKYMRGIKKFTLADLHKHEKEFRTRLEILQKAKKDNVGNESSPVREELEDSTTMNKSSSIALQATRTNGASNRGSSIQRATPSDIGSDAELYHSFSANPNPQSHDPDLSTEEIGHIVDEHFSQESPTNIVLFGGSASGTASEKGLESSPRMNSKPMSTANVAPTATMMAPLTTAELTIAATEVLVNDNQRPGQAASNPANSQEQIEQSLELNVNNDEPNMLEICSSNVPVLSSPEHQLQQSLSLTAELVELGKGAATQSLDGLPTKSIESQIIAGTTRRQLDTTKRAKRTKKVKFTIKIHEDIPGNTPKASKYRPHNLIANDIPKENMDTDEEDEDETAGSLLTGFGARGHAAQIRERTERAGTELLPGVIVSTPASRRDIRLPVPGSRVQSMGRGSSALPETELEHVVQDGSGRGMSLFASPSGRVPVIVPRARSLG